MKILRNAYYTIDTIFAGGVPAVEEQNACYVYKKSIRLDIKKSVVLDSQEERVTCELRIDDALVKKTSNMEHLFCILEAMGYQVGDHDGEGVTLTEDGEQEVALLSSIPYLFSQNTEKVF